MNKFAFIGNLTKAPKSGKTQSGTVYCRFSVAVNRHEGGEQKTDYFDVLTWNKVAENCGKYLTKGTRVGVTGTVKTGNYDKDGVKYPTWEVWADSVDFLSDRKENDPPKKSDELKPTEDEDDLPF